MDFVEGGSWQRAMRSRFTFELGPKRPTKTLIRHHVDEILVVNGPLIYRKG